MQATQFVEEMASILLTPFVLYYSLPYCTEAILEFVRDHTVFVEGVGDICSLANFDFEKHGNSKYGAVTHCPKVTIATALGHILPQVFEQKTSCCACLTDPCIIVRLVQLVPARLQGTSTSFQVVKVTWEPTCKVPVSGLVQGCCWRVATASR